jgi:hypothetical protein
MRMRFNALRGWMRLFPFIDGLIVNALQKIFSVTRFDNGQHCIVVTLRSKFEFFSYHASGNPNKFYAVVFPQVFGVEVRAVPCFTQAIDAIAQVAPRQIRFSLAFARAIFARRCWRWL